MPPTARTTAAGGSRGRAGLGGDGAQRGRVQEREPGTGGWGSVARRGVRALRSDSLSASEEWRAAVGRADRGDSGAAWIPDEVWVLDPEGAGADAEPGPGMRRAADRMGEGERDGGINGPARYARQGAGDQAADGSHRRTVPRGVVDELSSAAGATRGSKLAGRLADATHAYDRERYQDARRILRPLVEEVPDAVAVQELYGLTLYRMGQWAQSAKHLERHRELSGSHDQHPVLADCYRALHRYAAAAVLWKELKEASPSAELVAEGRIVEAGCHADQGDLQGAIAVLERAAKRVNHPQEHHLRQWYTLADLYERAGDLPRARELFGRVGAADPDAFDVRQRLRALR